MRVDANCILLREGDFTFWHPLLAFASLIREVFYIQNLVSIPSMGKASVPASGKSSCNNVECMAHDFVILVYGQLFYLVGPGAHCHISPTRARFV